MDGKVGWKNALLILKQPSIRLGVLESISSSQQRPRCREAVPARALLKPTACQERLDDSCC